MNLTNLFAGFTVSVQCFLVFISVVSTTPRSFSLLASHITHEVFCLYIVIPDMLDCTFPYWLSSVIVVQLVSLLISHCSFCHCDANFILLIILVLSANLLHLVRQMSVTMVWVREEWRGKSNEYPWPSPRFPYLPSLHFIYSWVFHLLNSTKEG